MDGGGGGGDPRVKTRREERLWGAQAISLQTEGVKTRGEFAVLSEAFR